MSEKVYTLEEAAEAMRMTPRGVAKVGKKHGCCMVAGRKILFTAEHLAKLQEALTWDSNSSNARRRTTSAEPPPDSAFARLLARATKTSPKRQTKD